MKKGAIFDMDGTLFDTETLYRQSWMWAAAQMGYFAHPGHPVATCGVSGPKEIEIAHRFYPGADVDKMRSLCQKRYKELSLTQLRLMKGVNEILAFFRENGVKMAIASSSRHETINRNIKQGNIEEYFDVITSGENVIYGKPAPDIFLLAAEKLGLPPEDCYVFEDGLNGVYAGIASGAATIMILDLSQPDAKAKNGCAGIFNDMLEAIEAIKAGKL